MKVKKLLIIPIVLFIFSVAVLLYNKYTTGDFLLKGVDLRGGTLVTIETSQPVNTKHLEDVLTKRYGSVLVSGLRTATGYGATIEVPMETNTTQLLEDVKSLGISTTAFSVESIGPTLSSMLMQQILYVLIAAFVLMSIVIFLVYRRVISSFGTVFASLANILTTLALTSLLGIKLSFAGFAGLLMLIAYTVDTNIVLTTKTLHTTPENFHKQYKKALITGLTLIMTITTTMFITQLISMSKLLVNLAQILVVGFLSDLPYTWIFNAGVLELSVERRFK